MILRVTAEELGLFQQYPLPWWSLTARHFMGRVGPGTPAMELEEDENGDEVATGYYLMSHPGIDKWDQYLLDVMRAGWAYADTQENGTDLVLYQQATDWQAWEDLKQGIEVGAVTIDEAYELAKAYIIALGDSLGVPLPAEDEPE